MTKKGKIASCTFTKEWQAPDKTILYYHVILFENGESGSCALKSKNQYEIGEIVEYELNGEKLRIHSNSRPLEKTFNNYKKSSGGSKKPEDYLGFVYGYAKDIHIAKMQIAQQPRPIEDMLEEVERIYQHVQEMLNA